MEDTIDSLTEASELLDTDTIKVVVAFSRYACDNILSRRLNVLFTKKWGPPVLAHAGIMWTYTKFYNGTTIKMASDSTLVHVGVTPSTPLFDLG